MGIRARLIMWLVALTVVSTGIALIAGTNATTRSTQGSLERRSAILGKAIQSAAGIARLVEGNQSQQLSLSLAQFARADQDIDYVLLTNGRYEVLGWAVSDENPNPSLQDAKAVQVIADRYYGEDSKIDSPELVHNVPMVFEVADVPAPQPVPASAETAPKEKSSDEAGENTARENAQAGDGLQADSEPSAIDTEKLVSDTKGKHALQANLLVFYKPHARQLFASHSKNVILASLLPCITFIVVLLFVYMGNLASRLDFLRRYTLGLAGGDLTQPFVERGEREFNELGQALNQMRRSFKQSIAGVQGASREFSSATKRVHESSGKITEDAIEQSQAIRQTVTSIDAMATSSSSVQNQLSEATRAATESTELLQGIRRSIENIQGSMQMLSKSVDQTRRHLEGNISILGEVDRAVNQLQETATSTVSATAEIADNIRNVDSNTQTALRMSNEAATKAETGVEAFKESMAAIQRIRANSDESANSIRFLSEKTESIEHILDVIDDISNRTRLLSLNASIIASKAGEAGRGFMIVADEIKDLASRTAGSTREIAKIISEVRDGSEGAIEVVERGVRAVNEGVKRAEFAGEILTQIVSSTNQSGNLVQRISTAMNRQAQGTKQVSTAMRDVHSVVIRVREVVAAQKAESRDLEASIRTMRIQMSRATATAKQQQTVIQETIKIINNIFQQIQLISNSNDDQVRNQVNVSKAVDRLKQLSDLHHASADNLSMAVENSQQQSQAVADGLKAFRV